MKIIKPSFYDDFKCSADMCQNPCCKAGWQIIIDDETLSFYNSCGGEIGKKLKENIDTKSDEPMFKYKGSSCAFFDSDGLCEIQKEFGHNRLCRTCRMYPRYEYTFGGVKELGLELSCPTVAKILYSHNEKISFIEETNINLPCPNEIDGELFKFLLKCREKSIEIIQDDSLPLNERISSFLLFNKQVRKCIRKKKYTFPNFKMKNLTYKVDINKHLKKLRKLEILTDEWKNLLEKRYKNLEFADFSECENFNENLLVYFVYRYYLFAAYDKKVLARARFCVLPLFLNYHFSKTAEDYINTSVLISREIEHSEENVSKLIRYFSKRKI